MRLLACVLFLMPAVFIAAQDEKEKWQRVYTGEDSIIEIDVSRVTFASARVGRARFRIILSKPEVLKEKPAIKYKSRLETIEFRCGEKRSGVRKVPPDAVRYRLYEATLLDAKGKILKTYDWNPAEDWREVRFG